MRILRSLCIAFSIYSKIPVPQFQWKDEDMKDMLCFFPWVGGVLGGTLYLWFWLSDWLELGTMCHTLIGAAIPLLITGGFHVDGFMDTMDALHSYQPIERKLEILKDPHIGAFSVIMLAVYGMVFLGAFSELRSMDLVTAVCAGFFLSRALSGIGVVSFKSAKHDGLLFMFANSAHKTSVLVTLYFQCALAILFMIKQAGAAGVWIVTAALGVFGYYYIKCKKELGGITGDTAGYFVTVCELGIVVAAAVIEVLR
ncbi:MAG: adenosylcobinamide-GDP ribazoletransferase [Lachnospiraceae bacterium]|nr:adenosylcobinamide-GDP ribazoletransferase [Lachnospiraceae bacterium]